MTTALRFSTSLPSALLVLLMALPASAEESPESAPSVGPRKRSLSASLNVTPFYFGEAVGFTSGGGDYYSSAEDPLLVGFSADYMYKYDLVRLGFGLRYSHTWDTSPGWSNFYVHELGATALLGLGGTTKGGVDFAATLGLGIGHSWIPTFDLYPPSWGVTGELLVSVAIPVTRYTDFLLRSGLRVAFYKGNLPENGMPAAQDAFLARAYIPFEVGFRRRF
ncbi:hypothetical protein [Polyangium mundeleinium]|uniref:Outer membrane protein beta-barrel domain-containing protein n=1 Tax=Polyangium mundeleinium TaxID=2995306 RepID=A0ABT5EIG7_9BACT|nr:hypothetical protein [Polyangium mundeleinium]MDC0740727.1 hypothetical protein [Polyangium mundeleinium]